MIDTDASPLTAIRPILGLVITAAVIMGTPGPATIGATAAGAAFGWRQSIPFVASLIAGTTAVLMVVAAGVFTLILSLPHAPAILTIASAAYILHLAWQIANAPPLQTGGDAPAPLFSGGLLLGIANPKAYLAIAAVLNGTTVSAGSAVVDGAVKVAVLTTMIVAIHLAWLLAGAALSRILSDPRLSRLVNLGFAFVLVATTAVTLIR